MRFLYFQVDVFLSSDKVDLLLKLTTPQKPNSRKKSPNIKLPQIGKGRQVGSVIINYCTKQVMIGCN